MKEFNIVLNENDVHNLNQFLSTVKIQGNQAFVFTGLLNKINSQAQSTPEKEVKDNVK